MMTVRPLALLLYAVALIACAKPSHEIKKPNGRIVESNDSIANSDTRLATGLRAAPQEKHMMTATEVNDAAKPALSAIEVGKRFLKLIEGLESRDDITIERIQEAMGLKLDKESPNGPFFYQPLADGWSYNLHFIPEKPGMSKEVGLVFGKKGDRFADMSPVCGLTFEGYHNALKAMGYIDSFHYDQINGEVGRLLGVSYEKGEFSVGITPELKRFPDGKVYPACVQWIYLRLNGKEA